eukprot:jgi/Tetstr1/463938/TSEL_008743.t1
MVDGNKHHVDTVCAAELFPAETREFESLESFMEWVLKQKSSTFIAHHARSYDGLMIWKWLLDNTAERPKDLVLAGNKWSPEEIAEGKKGHKVDVQSLCPNEQLYNEIPAGVSTWDTEERVFDNAEAMVEYARTHFGFINCNLDCPTDLHPVIPETKYVSANLKTKVDASGAPKGDIEEFIDGHEMRFGFQLEHEKLEANPGMRALAKISLS